MIIDFVKIQNKINAVQAEFNQLSIRADAAVKESHGLLDKSTRICRQNGISI